MTSPPDASRRLSSRTHEPPEAPDNASLATSSGFRQVQFQRFRDAKRFAWLVLLAWVLSRGLLPALPGTAAGLGTWISGVEASAALLSQWTAILGCALGMLVLFSVLTQSTLGYGYRMLCMTAAGFLLAIITLVIPRPNIGPAWGVGAGLCAAILSLAGAWVSMLQSKTRAVGLLLTLATCSSLVTTMARVLALRAAATSDIASFESARLIATISSVTDLALLGWVVLWLTAGRMSRTLIWGAALAFTTVGLSWFAHDGASQTTSLAHLLAARTIEALLANPAPYLNLVCQAAIELSGPVLVVALLLTRRLPPSLTATAALALLAGGDGDIPMSALMLGLSGLLAGLGAALARQPTTADEHP